MVLTFISDSRRDSHVDADGFDMDSIASEVISSWSKESSVATIISIMSQQTQEKKSPIYSWNIWGVSEERQVCFSCCLDLLLKNMEPLSRSMLFSEDEYKQRGHDLLIEAIDNNEIEHVRVLLKCGVDPILENEQVKTALSFSESSGVNANIKLMIAATAGNTMDFFLY